MPASSHPAVVPLIQLDTGLFVQELFHGPTLSFKDMALQLLGRLFDHVLAARDARVTIVGATSGDTGSAAIEACAGRDRIDIAILHPHDRTSEVQRRQMTTVTAPNVANIAIEGTFDDCQDLVKAMFADAPFRQEMQLSAVNSINWARIAAQIPYYVAAALALGAPDREVAFSVPTGNFGNVLAAWAARRMGLPVARLIVGSNRNDILARFLAIERHVDRHGGTEPVAQHGHSGQFQLRASAVRTAGPRCRQPPPPRWPSSAAPGRWRCPMRPGIAAAPCSMASGWTTPGPRPRSPGCIGRAATSPIRTPRSASPPRTANPPGHGVPTAVDGDGASGEVSRGDRARHRPASRPAAAARRSVRPARALHRAAE